MTRHLDGRLRRCQLACITASLALIGTLAAAQSVPLSAPPPVAEVRVPEVPSPLPAPAVEAPVASVTAPAPEPEAEWRPALKVGEATYGLLALQAGGTSASKTSRPVTGDVAARIYPRYLKSFEYPIPEKFGATVKSPGLNGGSSGTATP